jgi:hypothetical protein
MIAMSKPLLQLQDLDQRHPGVSLGVSAGYSEAASVCLGRHHVPPVDFSIERPTQLEVSADWRMPGNGVKRAWANETDTTEAGAYCIALAAIETTDGLVAIARAETRTGADYYLGPQGVSLDDLEKSHRLEVSGVDDGGPSIVKSRLRQKMRQAAAGNSSLPAIAAVVGFSARQVMIADVE